jgi:hypothetical protein
MFFILIDLFYTIVSIDFIKNQYFILSIFFFNSTPPWTAACIHFIKIPDFIAHNVPAVCDVLPARIRALRSKYQGWQNVGGVSRANEAVGRLS